jgi:EAL domain-containing protein (putative c-di-GMP-specific phosphodiesterase class I)/GGDEF domain-containing protein
MKREDFRWMNMGNEAFLEDLLDLIMKKDSSKELLEIRGQEVYNNSITFSQLSILFDTFSYTLSLEEKKILQKNENFLAKGYLKVRLPQEVKLLKLGIHNNPNLITKKDLSIIDELLVWLEKLIEHILYDTEVPDISQRIEIFTEYINEKVGIYFKDPDIKSNFLKTNKELYRSAKLALEFYNKGQYFYFVLIYIEMIALFLKMVTLLGSMFVEDLLLSIYIDPITLLPNRFQLLKDMDKLNNLVILIINIKSFSKINLLHSYDIGDILLKKVATFLKVQDSIKSYRIYGDEFAILVNNEKEAEKLFENINNSVSITIANTSYHIYFYGAYNAFEKLALERCELALINSAKNKLIDTKEITALTQKYKYELTMVQKLKEIMITDSIVPYYQPIYSCGDLKRVIKYEVLMRVQYKNTILEPKDFLDALLGAPFYTEFTKTMLFKSFEMFKDIELDFSVNFTTTDIKDKSVKLFLETLIAKYPQVAKRLTIEILETEALNEFEIINEFIKYLKKHGVKFALDDFGSGYSNFAQIAKLDIDFIKIDGSIIHEITDDTKMQTLLEAILAFADTMKIQTVAEFVHNEAIFEYLKDRVSMMQGYYIGKPEALLLPNHEENC